MYQFTEREWPDWWFFSKEKKLVHDEHVDSKVGKVSGMGKGRASCAGLAGLLSDLTRPLLAGLRSMNSGVRYLQPKQRKKLKRRRN